LLFFLIQKKSSKVMIYILNVIRIIEQLDLECKLIFEKLTGRSRAFSRQITKILLIQILKAQH